MVKETLPFLFFVFYEFLYKWLAYKKYLSERCVTIPQVFVL